MSELDEVRRSLGDLSIALAVHAKTSEDKMDRIADVQERQTAVLEKLADVMQKKVNGNGGWTPPVSSNGGLSPKFVLQVIGLLLAFGLVIGGGQKTIDMVVGWATHFVEAKAGGK